MRTPPANSSASPTPRPAGTAAAIYHDGAEFYACHGVTGLENPLPVDEGTLFQFGSTGKTYTATAVMRLVERGQIDLDAPVRRYLPEFRLTDEQAARDVTVLHLLNRRRNAGRGIVRLHRDVRAQRSLGWARTP